MNSDEFYEFEDRAYLNPTLSSGEQEAFINNLRNTQNQNNAQIAEQTHNLGTEVPSNLGGLGGGEAYFTSRYQTPQVGEMTETLKAAAQAQALNDVMSNYNTQLQNRYKQAYRSAQSRARRRASGTGGTGSTDGTKDNTSGWDGDIKTIATGDGNDSPIYNDIRIGDDVATYGLGMIYRNEGETDDAWHERASKWGELQAMKRNLSKTGQF